MINLLLCKHVRLHVVVHGIELYHGIPTGNRTPDNGLGNRRVTTTPSRNKLAEEVGFEPTEPFDSAVFKTGAFNRSATLPKLVPNV
jgi:hypothetical protein